LFMLHPGTSGCSLPYNNFTYACWNCSCREPRTEKHGTTNTDEYITPPTHAAIAACTEKMAGDTCQFTDRNSSAEGTCDNKPGVLACAPARKQTAEGEFGEQTTLTGTNVSRDTALPGIAQTSQVSAGTDKGSFVLSSSAGHGDGTMSAEYTCDGAGSTPAFSWSGAPNGTKEFALMMTTIPVDKSTRWNWVLYDIPGTTTGLVKNSTNVGITGTGSHGTVMQYDPPCSQGPGTKIYTFTLFALSTSPNLPGSAANVTGPVLTSAISSITLGKGSIDLSYARS
jgi:phosphatidylethanolamine-binding protein (PEBP) family uncharacterized protein